MQDDEPCDEPIEKPPIRKQLQLPLSSLNTLLRNAKETTRKAKARENWIRSIRAERIRTDKKDHGGEE